MNCNIWEFKTPKYFKNFLPNLTLFLDKLNKEIYIFLEYFEAFGFISSDKEFHRVIDLNFAFDVVSV